MTRIMLCSSCVHRSATLPRSLFLAGRLSFRLSYSTETTSSPPPPPPPAKVPVALISAVRNQRPGTPLSLARSALQATKNDVYAALTWISNQAAASGAKKAEKLKDRTANEGLVGVSVLADGTGDEGVRVAMVELSCETDFVARTDEFRDLVEDVARSIAFFTEPESTPTVESSDGDPPRLSVLNPDTVGDMLVVPSPEHLSSPTPALAPASTASSPSLSRPSTVSQSVAAIVSRLGEKISVRRAQSIAIDPPTSYRVSTYVHQPRPGSRAGPLASLVLLKDESATLTDKLARAIARQVAAVPTESGTVEELSSQILVTLPSESLDEKQKTVGEVIEDGRVIALVRWEVGQS